MDRLLDRLWSTESFLAWEDRQEGKHEFDGHRVVAVPGGSVAHQNIGFNLRVVLTRLLGTGALLALHEFRLRVGQWVRYPDVLVCAGPVRQTLRVLGDATVFFEVLSDDTASTDRVAKRIDYADVPSLQYDIMLEQASRGAIIHRRAPAGAWTATAHTEGDLVLSDLNLVLPLADIYQGPSFPPPSESEARQSRP